MPDTAPRCHCGLTRADAAAAAPAMRAAQPMAASPVSPTARRWRLKTAAGAVLVIGAFLSVRSCRLSGPREVARVAAMDLLGARLNRGPALEAYDKYHGSCFRAHCYDTWIPWRRPDFDKAAYVRCMENKLRVEAGFDPLPMPRRRPRRTEPTRAPSSTKAPAAATEKPAAVVIESAAETRTPPPSEGRLFLGEVKLVSFKRQPQMNVQVTFMALGAAELLPRAMCSYAITCGGVAQGLPEGERAITPCVTVEGLKGSGRLDVKLDAPAPAETECQMDLGLSDGAELRSDAVIVPLR